jgi:anti-sigma factor RsiW
MIDAINGHPRELLSAYLDDELGVEERTTIDRHLAACEDCRAQLEALRRLARAVADEGVPPVPVNLAARIGRRLDAATIVRPRRSRFVIPATIAATLGAIGILVALQWREGRLGVPVPPAPQEQDRAFDELKRPDAPSTTVAPEMMPAPRAEKEAAARQAVDKDVQGGVQGGVPGGVPGGVVGRVESVGAAKTADDERRDRELSKVMNEAVVVAPRVAAPSAMLEWSAKSEAVPSCVDRWSDSGLRGSWDVPDVDAAERQLGRIAHAVGGIGLWRGVADGRPYVVVVPRGRFEEVFYALRARGVAGLGEPPALSEGADCTGISVALTAVAEQTSPAPR